MSDEVKGQELAPDSTPPLNSEPQNVKRKKFHLDKKHIHGFIAGIVVAAIIFSGLYIGTNSSFLTGTVSSRTIVNDSNFTAEVINADRPVLVVVTATWYNNDIARQINLVTREAGEGYSRYFKVVYMDYDSCIYNASKYEIKTVPLLALFQNGTIVAERSTAPSADELVKWVYTTGVTWEPHTNSKSQSQNQYPTIYYMFDSNSNYDRITNYEGYDFVGEYRLFPFEVNKDSFVKCSGQTLTGNDNNALFPMFGTSVNGELAIHLPDMTSKTPLDGLTYYICRKGCFPQEPWVESYVKGDIKYFRHENVEPYEYSIGEIKLAMDVDDEQYGSFMVPCDGRELKINDYQALYELMGTKYGGDGKTTFKIPDLTDKSPIAGAQYYIILNGLWPLY